MALRLPDDVWTRIADISQSSTLSHVCHRLHRLLEHRHVSFTPTKSNVSDCITWLRQCSSQIRTLRLASSVMCGSPCDIMRLLAAIGDLEHVQVIHLALQYAWIGDGGAVLLGKLRQLPNLHTIEIGHPIIGVTAPGIRAFCDIKVSSSLRRLILARFSPTLEDGGAIAFASLKEAGQLQVLHLDLSDHSVSSVGASALAQLRDSPMLTELQLNLNGNHIEDAGALQLASLAQSKSLHSLNLGLRQTNITDRGGGSLLALGLSSALSSLRLDLGANAIGDAFVPALAAMKSNAMLRYLYLDLSDNVVTDAGKRLLQQMAKEFDFRCELCC